MAKGHRKNHEQIKASSFIDIASTVEAISCRHVTCLQERTHAAAFDTAAFSQVSVTCENKSNA